MRGGDNNNIRANAVAAAKKWKNQHEAMAVVDAAVNEIARENAAAEEETAAANVTGEKAPYTSHNLLANIKLKLHPHQLS